MKKQNYLPLIACLLMTFLAKANEMPQVMGIDLELKLSAENLYPGSYNKAIVIATLENKGTEMATNVVVNFNELDGELTILASSATTSGGGILIGETPPPPTDDLTTWTITSLKAGESTTIELIYLIRAIDVACFAQITTADQEDIDSTPNSGACCTADEDDESVLIFNEGVTDNGTPDFIGFSLEFKVTLVPMGTVTDYSFVVQNNGDGAANGSYNMKAYLSLDNKLDTDDVLVSTLTTSNLLAGAMQVMGGRLDIPADIPSERYRLLVLLDADNLVEEENETNNLLISDRHIVISPFFTAPSINLDATLTNWTTYPNPAPTSLFVQTEVAEAIRSSIEIYDLSGRLQLQQQVNLPKGRTSVELNIQDLPEGLFFIKMEGKTMQFVKG